MPRIRAAKKSTTGTIHKNGEVRLTRPRFGGAFLRNGHAQGRGAVRGWRPGRFSAHCPVLGGTGVARHESVKLYDPQFAQRSRTPRT
jgi:hypothetical protein